MMAPMFKLFHLDEIRRDLLAFVEAGCVYSD